MNTPWTGTEVETFSHSLLGGDVAFFRIVSNMASKLCKTTIFKSIYSERLQDVAQEMEGN